MYAAFETVRPRCCFFTDCIRYRQDSTSLGDMLDELASSVAAAQGVVDRVKRLHNTFNEKVSAPFTELQREAQETGSSDLPLVRSKMDAAQQALVRVKFSLRAEATHFQIAPLERTQ